jgi:hypothetical protein
MKTTYIISLLLPLSIIFSGCDTSILNIGWKVDNSTLINNCKDNGWYAVAENDTISCYFENSYCDALDLYNWKCFNEPYMPDSFDESLAEEKCKEINWTVESVNAWWEDLNLCFFSDGSVCSLKEVYDWECNIEWDNNLIAN